MKCKLLKKLPVGSESVRPEEPVFKVEPDVFCACFAAPALRTPDVKKKKSTVDCTNPVPCST